MKHFEQVKENFKKKERDLSLYATTSDEAIRFKKANDLDVRTPFFRDVDRIVNALSYTRYADKTQVYSYLENDHISKRMVHVQLVSRIARTIGIALNLNTDLIEAIALGHDIGHTPLGHVGERLLNEISLKELGEYFAHNVQSVRYYMQVENNGMGLNLTVQVLDGIFCHNGEILSNEYVPEEKTKEEFLKQYENAYRDLEGSKKHSAMTLEGCVVRISDVIGYIGRDVEDAIQLGLLSREQLPSSVTKILGNQNKDIIGAITMDIIDNSLGKPYIKMSDEVYQALMELKDFNYKNIYNNSTAEQDKEFYRTGMQKIYSRYLRDIEKENKESIIYKIFLNSQSTEYLKETNPKRMVIDFIAGMTDDLFLQEIKNDMI